VRTQNNITRECECSNGRRRSTFLEEREEDNLIRGEDDEVVVVSGVVVVVVTVADESVGLDFVSCGGAEMVPVMTGALDFVSCGGAEMVTTVADEAEEEVVVDEVDEVDEVEVVGGVVVDEVVLVVL
jgi:hypothetical protein